MQTNLTGNVFTRLTVLSTEGTRGKNSYLKCQCSCGTVKSIRRDSLLNGDAKSCGCLGQELEVETRTKAKARRTMQTRRKKLIERLNKTFLEGKDMTTCEHARKRHLCKDCGGGSICEHEKIRVTCSICSPDQVFARYQRSAKKRGLRFDLSLDQFRKLVKNPCAACRRYSVPRGVDRIRNDQPYVLWNCQPLCWRCNRAKNVMSYPDFIAMCDEVHHAQQQIKKQHAAATAAA